ncbi:hypothetical protein [Teredinibacter turnerae]|uniref:hypothetical protein n=1 Tax=Teredinibacter turnerae TaxID=2426 RepID=UPI00037F0B72|nr:hypothetical protein [Teredinibacter turnerae]
MRGEWHEEIVRFRVNDNWSQEVCFSLDEKTEASVRYEFTAQVPVKFDFHFHPSEGEYATTHFLRLKGADLHQGVADIGDVGIYCFDFFPGTRVKQERTATLRYRVD